MTDKKPEQTKLMEGIDYYLEGGLFVLTRFFLLKRGYCCHSGCRHCPYQEKPPNVSDAKDLGNFKKSSSLK